MSSVKVTPPAKIPSIPAKPTAVMTNKDCSDVCIQMCLYVQGIPPIIQSTHMTRQDATSLYGWLGDILKFEPPTDKPKINPENN